MTNQTPDPGELEAKAARLEIENRDLERLADGLRQALSELRDGQIERLADIEQRLDDALQTRSQALIEREEALREAQSASRRLNQVYGSFTWKAGTAIKRMIDPFLAIRRRSDVRRLDDRSEPSTPVVTAPSRTRTNAVTSIRSAGQSTGRAVELAVLEDAEMKSLYESATSKREFTGDDRRRVVMAVTTLDFGEGRGDLFVAVGLGRYLERIGYEVIYLPSDRWYALPPKTDIYVALLSSVDASSIPAGPVKVAWARNETERWATNPSIYRYDLVLGSSRRSLDYLERVYPGPTELLPIAVDHELFHPGDGQERSAVVSTVNQWGRERDVYAALRGAPIRFPLAIYGQTRGLAPDLLSYSHGPVSFFALPGIYRQAEIVLDDFNHTTIQYGNVNSRLFESIAAGAVPVANTGLGLGELGLDAVPTYSAPSELHDIVTRLRSGAPLRSKLADELGEVVRRDHSFEKRAGQFHNAVVEGQGQRSTRTVVAFSPDYRSTNPFQSMLYESLGREFVPVPIADVLEMEELKVPYLSGAILHIHWTAPVLAPAKTSSEALARLHEFLDLLGRLREGGVRLVWTVHNVMPHESGYPDLEQVLRQELADRADVIHVMCERTLEVIGDRYAIPIGKTRLVPHASFVGVYPDVVDPDLARERLGYTADDTVILYFGSIRHYKGLDLLITAFEEAVDREPSLRLLIAGRRGRFPEMPEMERRAASHPLIAANFNEIADADLQHFFKAADVVALPYRTILNSGSVNLAFSFARPVIAPREPCLPDVEGHGVGLSYRQGDLEGLTECLVNSPSLRDREYQHAAMRLAQSYTGGDMSLDFKAVLEDLQRQIPINHE